MSTPNTKPRKVAISGKHRFTFSFFEVMSFISSSSQYTKMVIAGMVAKEKFIKIPL